MKDKKQVTLHGFPIFIDDHVWSQLYGWMTILKLDPCDTLSIWAEDEKGDRFLFDKNGKENPQDLNPTLFWKEQQFDLSKPLPQLKVDTLLEVWDYESNNVKLLRYFSHFDSHGRVNCFSNGTTSFTHKHTSIWSNYRIYKEKC